MNEAIKVIVHNLTYKYLGLSLMKTCVLALTGNIKNNIEQHKCLWSF